MNDRERSIHLSPVQVVASALASITAAVLASFFGVAGTVIGAGVVSAAASVGNAVYSYWIRSTNRAIRSTIPSALWQSGTTVRTLVGSGARVGGASSGQAATGGPPPADPPPGDPQSTNEVPVIDASTDVPPPGSLRPPPLPPSPGGGAAETNGTDVRSRVEALWQSVRRVATSLRWRNIAVATAVVFVVSMGAVTAVEALAKKPLSGIVGGSAPAGATTSLGGLVSGGQPSKPSPNPPSSPSGSTTTTPGTSPGGSSTTTSTSTTTTTSTPSSTTTAPGRTTPGSSGSTPGGTGSTSGGSSGASSSGASSSAGSS